MSTLISPLGDGADVATAKVRRGFKFGPDVRLRSHEEFAYAQQHGRRVQGRYFLFILFTREGGGPARLGLVASRKVGNSPARNRVKRLCREVFRRDPDWVPPGTDVIVIPRVGAAALSYAEVATDWRRALPRASLAGPRS